ncbi:MAG: prepilin peptidase [Actinobacteria bacterium]|nr:prepilin peptidase [Actinomycetota bacterium]
MKDSSIALGQPVRSSRLQTLATVELPRNRRSDEVLHADVVLAGPNPQPLDQRTRELRCQRVDWFVSFDTRARHSARIRLLADGSFTRTQTARRIPAYLYAPPAKSEFGGGDTVKCSGVAMLHTTPTQAAVDDLEQRGPRAGTIGAGLAIAALLAVVYVGRAEVLMMPALGMIAVTAAVVDARTLRIPNWLTGTGAFVLAVLSVYLVVVQNAAWQPLAAGAAIMGGPLLAAHLVSKSRTPGLGDVKLATVLGAPLGAISPAAAYWALLMALSIGAGFGLIYQRATKRRAFPLGPAISLAFVLTAFAFGLTDSNGVWTL